MTRTDYNWLVVVTILFFIYVWVTKSPKLESLALVQFLWLASYISHNLKDKKEGNDEDDDL